MWGRWKSRRTYTTECGRIFYWAFFKPYTFRRRLREIDPDLDTRTDPFRLQNRFDENPRLRRYASQIWCMAAVIPLLLILLIGSVHVLFLHTPFALEGSCKFLLGWWSGLWLTWITKEEQRRQRLLYFVYFLDVAAMVVILVLLASRLAPSVFPSSLGLLPGHFPLATLRFLWAWWPVAFGIASGVALGVASGVAGGIALGAALGIAVSAVGDMMLGVVLSAAFGAAFSVVFGVGFGVAFGAAVGTAISVAGSVALGVAFGVAYTLGVLRFYFWLPELIWMAVLAFLAWPGHYARWLQYLPPQFDELIVLPLPFMDELIARAYWENQASARQMIEHLITHTNQQKVASRAITRIAIESLLRCQTLGDISAVADQLEWIPHPPPEQLGPFLPRFLEVAQGVRAALAERSFYRRAQLVKQAIRRLKQLREGLASQPASFATLYGEIVDSWLRVLEDVRKEVEEKARASAELPQVYVAGPPLDPETAGERFRGREDIFHEISTLALSNVKPVLLLYGGRRTGKTSVLKYLPRRVGPEILPLLVDVQGVASATKLVGLAEELAREIIKSARKARNFDLPFPDTNALQQDPFIALQRWMDRVERITGERTLLLCLDEFERLEEVVRETKSRAPLNFLRHVMQHRVRWTLLFSGSHMLDELAIYWSDYLINARTLRVSYLSEEDTRGLVQHPVRDFPDIYDENAVDAIVYLTRGQPFLVQLTCFELVERLNREKRRRVRVEDVEAIIPVLFERGYYYFKEFWTDLTKEQQAALLTLAQRGSIQDVQRSAAERMVVKGILKRVGETYRFQVPLIQRWVEERAERT